MMRKLLLITMLLVFSVAANAQNDVTRFLGIPVDGSKSEMIRKIKARSISYDSDVLEGEFNGRDVHIHVATNNDKVYRVMVSDVNAVNERSIQIRFNRLCEQFANNSKYISLKEQTIPDNENISYEMTVKKKRYEAIFLSKAGRCRYCHCGKAVIHYTVKIYGRAIRESNRRNSIGDSRTLCEMLYGILSKEACLVCDT